MPKRPYLRPVVIARARQAHGAFVGPSEVAARPFGDRGELHASSVRIVLIESSVERSSVTTDVHLRGRGRPGHVTFALAARLSRNVVVASSSLTQGDILCYGPDAEFDGVQPADATVHAMAVSIERLGGTVHEIGEQRVETRRRAIVARPPDAQRCELESLHDEIAELALRAPEQFDDEGYRSVVEESLIEAWLSALAASDVAHGAHVAAKRAAEIAAAFDEWLVRDDAARPSISSACVALGLTRRSLERAIVTARGTSPAEYLRGLRLHALNADLRDRANDGRSVADLALAHGFWHAGRLAAQYRGIFGETPSRTRRRHQGE